MLPCISLYSNSPNTHTDMYSFRAVEHRGGLTVTGMFRASGRTEKGDGGRERQRVSKYRNVFLWEDAVKVQRRRTNWKQMRTLADDFRGMRIV